MRLKKQKRGFLLAEETLKLILAVIAIGFLAYLLFSLYNAGKSSKDLELAKESLGFLLQEMNAEKTSVDIYNPRGWYIISWSFEGEQLLSCSNLGWQSCICICDDSINPFSSESDECNSAGACLENTQGFSLAGKINIDNPPVTLNIDYETKTIS